MPPCPVSTSRSSNRTCGSPASGSPTGFKARRHAPRLPGTFLLPLVPSAIPGVLMSLLGHMASARPIFASRTLPKSGPFPPPALPGFLGTMGLSDFLHSPACPSRASGWSSHTTTEEDLPCCVAVPLAACHRHYPGGIQEDQGSFVNSLDGGLPHADGRSASATGVFGACSTFTAAAYIPQKRPLLWPAGSLSCPRQPFDIEGLRRFVTSPATSTASGRNDKIPAWVSHPQDQQHLNTAHARSASKGS